MSFRERGDAPPGSAAGLREQHERRERHGDDAQVVDGHRVRPGDEQPEWSAIDRPFDERRDAPWATYGINDSLGFNLHGDLLVADSEHDASAMAP